LEWWYWCGTGRIGAAAQTNSVLLPKIEWFLLDGFEHGFIHKARRQRKEVKSSGYANMIVSIIDDASLPHRVLLLVKGTEDTQLLPIANSESKARMILTKNAKCLLSDESPNITMKGYASEVDLLKLAPHEDFGLVT
jgi:hypothetical protein